MPEDGEAAASAIASDIQHYLSAHPDAADTMTGIRAWWLSPTFAGTPLGVVETALELLIERGAVTSTRLPDGRVLYAAGRGPRA
jgi:hypothetical protein